MEYKNVCDTDIYEKNSRQLKCLFGNKIALIHILMLFEWWLMAAQSQTKRWGILPPLPCFRPLLQYIPLGHQGPHDLLQQWTPCTAAGSKFQVTCSEFRSNQTCMFPAAWLDIKVVPCWKDLTTNWRQNSWLCVEVLKNWEQVGSVGSGGKIRKAQGAAASTSFFRRDTHIRARLPHARAVANSAS